MFRSYVVVPAVLAAALAVAGGVAIAHPVEPIKPATALEKKYLHLRAEWNFTQDLTTVRKIDATNPVYYIGMPLSDSEKKRFRAQNRVGTYATTVTDLVSGCHDYSGLWLERVGNGAIVVALTDAPSAALRATIAHAVPSSVPIRFVRQKYSMATLQRLQDRISAEMTKTLDDKPFITTAGVDVTNNIVTATVVKKSQVARVYALFGHRMLRVTVGPIPVGTALSHKLSSWRYNTDASKVLALVTNEKTFAGFSTDRFGNLVIGLTAAPSARIAARVAAAAPAGVPVRFIRQTYSSAELSALQERVVTDLVDKRDAAILVTSTDVDFDHNTIAVTVSTPGMVGAVYERLGHDALHVSVGPGVDFQAASTWHSASSSTP